jgi:hypothetical protein
VSTPVLDALRTADLFDPREEIRETILASVTMPENPAEDPS